MPEINVSIGTEGDETMAADVSDERAELIVSESMEGHTSLMHNTRANEQSVFNIARNSSVKKFNEVGPIQAAAAEMIMKRPT